MTHDREERSRQFEHEWETRREQRQFEGAVAVVTSVDQTLEVLITCDDAMRRGSKVDVATIARAAQPFAAMSGNLATMRILFPPSRPFLEAWEEHQQLSSGGDASAKRCR